MITKAEQTDLQSIVGGRWVNTEPCQADTYSFYMNPELVVPDGGRFATRPAAVVLPKNTREVRELVLYCNRSDLKLKPISTGFGPWAAVGGGRVVLVDLRRMDQIIELDTKNGVAVIEPYVRAIDLQTRAMEKGWNVHVVSCGGNHSILASTAAGWGYGVTGPTMGYSGRNLLGAEWVLPTGEVLTLGSAGAGCGWFSADGPGPSLRGVLRGFAGSLGGLGIITKCAVKLYPWEGPAKWEIEGKSPRYMVKKTLPNLSMNILSFPSGQAMKDAGYAMGEAGIEYANFRAPMFFSALGITHNNQDLKRILESGVFQLFTNYALLSAMTARSGAEMQYKQKILEEILAENRGAVMPPNLPPMPSILSALNKMGGVLPDPVALFRSMPRLQKFVWSLPFGQTQARDTWSRLFWFLIRHAVNTQATFRPSQGMGTTLGHFDTWDLGVEQSEWMAREKRKYIMKGLILDDGGDLGCGGTFEGGHMGYLEGIVLYNSKNRESTLTAKKLVEAGADASIERRMGLPIAAFGQVMNQKFGPHAGNYHQWLGKIKAALDPQTASDPFFYAEAREE